MKWYNFSLMFLGFFLYGFYSIKALMNLSNEGLDKLFYVWFFYIGAENKYFTQKGLKYRKISYIMAGILLFGFILGGILSI